MNASALEGRISGRLDEFDCHPGAHELALLAAYCELLARWNRQINLTALPLDGFPIETIDVLIVEPLVFVRLMEKGHYDWLDFGSGGGSPAIPVKVMVPDVRLLLIEARSKKSAFLQEAIRTLELTNARVRTERIEALTEASVARLVTIRGVKIDSEVAQAAHRVLAPGGCLAAFATADELKIDGFHLERSVPLPSQGHVLHLLRRSE